MRKERLRLKSRMDGLPISVLVIEPDQEPKAVVQMLHGMCEYKERYLPFMKYLVEHGFACVIHDHRGHGKSIISKADYGFFYEQGAKAMIADTNLVNRYVHKRYQGLPCYMLGHSMGSLVARAFLKRNDQAIDGLIVCGSPSNNKYSKLGILLAKLASRLHGARAIGYDFNRLLFAKCNEKVGGGTSDNAWICSDEEVIKKYDNDERCGFVFTYNGFENLFKLVTWVYDSNNWKVTNPNLPIWFISGEEDACMVNKQLFKEAVNHLRSVGYNKVKYQLYKDMRHEILNEKDKKKVYRDILRQLEVWVDHRQ